MKMARLRGPAAFSTLGMRIQNEQSGSTSLFAQPMLIEPIPEDAGSRDQEAESSEQKAGNGDQEAEIEEGALKRAGLSPYRNQAKVTGASAPEESAFIPAPKLGRGALEARMEAALASLAELSGLPSPAVRQAHLALLKRWYYRPETRRAGEIFFPDAEGRWPVKAMLRGAGRVAAKMLAPASAN